MTSPEQVVVVGASGFGRECLDVLEAMVAAGEFRADLYYRLNVITLRTPPLRERFDEIQPLMRQLHWPTLLCHRLVIDDTGRVVDYKLRQQDPKRASVKALHSLNYRVLAAGDSYNDTTMLAEADVGFLIHAPQNVIDEFPQFKSVDSLAELKVAFVEASERALEL